MVSDVVHCTATSAHHITQYNTLMAVGFTVKLVHKPTDFDS